MKKKINYLEILKNRVNVVLSENTEKKALELLKRAAEQPPQRLFTLLYRPAFVYAIAALVLVAPLALIVFTYRGPQKNVIVYTAQETSRDMENLLLEYRGNDTVEAGKDIYRQDVTQVDVRLTSRGLIMKWENPGDKNLREVIIEKRQKKTGQMETLFPGNVNLYIDPVYETGDYYIIRCINNENTASKGVYILPGGGD